MKTISPKQESKDGRWLAIVQYAGDYRKTFIELAVGQDETYLAQKYSITTVSGYRSKGWEVLVIVLYTDEFYEDILPDGVHVVGLGPDASGGEASAISFLRDFNPTHLLLRSPFHHLLRWGIGFGCNISLTLADSFNGNGLRSWWHKRTLTKLLNHSSVRWVGNHGVTASRALVDMGVDSRKVVPWDWPYENSPADFQPKSPPTQGSVWKPIFVGSVSETKGVGDLMRAMQYCISNSLPVKLKIVGGGDLDYFRKMSSEMNAHSYIDFVGKVSNKSVVPLMREADIVVIPSRTAYPEGFPLTIYEALTARTPIVASDHPMFRQHLRDRKTAVIFRSGEPRDLAAAITNLMKDPNLYENLSFASVETWNSLQIPIKWSDFLSGWLSDDQEKNSFLQSKSMSNHDYI
jgi:glycosyltransferase involved in cell wall biosynthesis